MSFAPLLNTPLTDFDTIFRTSSIFWPQSKFCRNILLKYTDCIEAYGLKKGQSKCAELLFDTLECSNQNIQIRRSKAIREERLRQYKAGKIDKLYEEHPPLDAFMGF